MKILLYSTAFSPGIGGLETIARITADGLFRLGHDITVFCKTRAPDDADAAAYPIIRNASAGRLWAATRKCDVFFMFNMNLKVLHYPWLARKPLVICHHGWYGEKYEDSSLRIQLKKVLSRILAANTACSRAVASYLGGPVTVVPNAYDSSVFKIMPEVERSLALLFVGRLVSTKGVGLLLDALGDLKASGHRPRMTITGEGPEEQSLRRQVVALALEEQVTFTGVLRGESLARVMNAHRVLVVPSIPAEPFGIVALEGVACGCLVVASEQGGLREAVGPCGWFFPNGDRKALGRTLVRALASDPPSCAMPPFSNHLASHSPDEVVAGYERVLRCAQANHRLEFRSSLHHD